MLGYHRVSDEPPDPYGMRVGTRNFAEQMEVLHREATPTRLSDLTGQISRKQIRPGSVAVTFDDGYCDVSGAMATSLERLGVPMTLFVVSGALGEEFWWDELERIVLFAERLPAERCLRMGDVALSLPGDDVADGSRRRALFRSAYDHLQALDAAARRRALDDLRRFAGASSRREPVYRVSTAEELASLAAHDLFEIGAHGVTHVPLGRLSPDRQGVEILESRRQLEQVVGGEVRSFSYPHGSLASETTGLVRGAGYRRACTSDPDVVSARSDPFRVPRFWVPDCDGDAFARWLQRWL